MDAQVRLYPNWVEPGFFATMEIPILAGRTFYSGEQNAVIVSASFARQQWPGQNPLGQRVGDGKQKDVVVGVAGDAHVNALSEDDAVEQYWPAQQDDMPAMVVMVRFRGSPEQIAAAAKSISESLDPRLFPEIRQLKLLYKDNVSTIERVAAVVSLIGIVAVLLAGVGIVGLVGFTVSQRTKEIAIRMALGARPAQGAGGDLAAVCVACRRRTAGRHRYGRGFIETPAFSALRSEQSRPGRLRGRHRRADGDCGSRGVLARAQSTAARHCQGTAPRIRRDTMPDSTFSFRCTPRKSLPARRRVR